MRDPVSRDCGDMYELTLAGGLGPVLRTALGLRIRSTVHVCTAVSTEASPDMDLVDLMALLEAHGLEAEVVAGA